MTLPALNASDVPIAGVPWPRHKLHAIIAGLVAFLVVGVVTTSAAPAVLIGAGIGVAVGVALKTRAHPRR
ncbi:hypothetical protein BST27_04800 [Mycobacterium intermedium]|uniref:Uncharacterized protein n=1 Tax=Mycobacterium intermedium TaxID=28445 RepID=A0A1E3SMA9_MYCIE|nr:hypothetical protein [Mycobacterium intermedium]MCV6966976.1 hypothetical protein [Mycobacterium intermedium]ODR03295.1 hypothetical protein BHQ20_00125 [Mycobacterium intermedium]OPE50066.1 hypothetical protein BV508_11845 [Mycobacterium intermedium]ORB09676.1 hypothetical protein BST27_04800 [Mycobacterium intermedium]